MSELDVEALKRRRADMASAGVPMMLNGPQVDELIAALEDRDRLRAAAEEVRYEIDRQVSLSEVPQLRHIDWWRGRLRGALESRDG